jgi:hypothetical protein
MKKQILLLISIIISTLSMAQLAPRFGVRGGLSYSGIRGDAAKNLNSIIDYANGMVAARNHTGFFAGGYSTTPLSEVVSIEPALYYSQKGYELRGNLNFKGMDFLGASAKAQLNSHYVDLPVVVKANLAGFQVFAGPQVSYLLKSDLRTTAGMLGINLLNRNMDATQQFNRWDVGVTGGVGYQFTNGVNLMASYDHGLSRVDANQNLNAYNRAVKIGVGFTF